MNLETPSPTKVSHEVHPAQLITPGWLEENVLAGKAREILVSSGGNFQAAAPSCITVALCAGRVCPRAESEAFQARPTSAFRIRGASGARRGGHRMASRAAPQGRSMGRLSQGAEQPLQRLQRSAYPNMRQRVLST
jgi:hypothetical protein